jgi:hypothetical protein
VVDPASAGPGLPSYPVHQRSRRGAVKHSSSGPAEGRCEAVCLTAPGPAELPGRGRVASARDATGRMRRRARPPDGTRLRGSRLAGPARLDRYGGARVAVPDFQTLMRPLLGPLDQAGA